MYRIRFKVFIISLYYIMSVILDVQFFQQGGLCYSINNLVGNYLLATKNNLDFIYRDTEWLFKHTKGHEDYFNSVEIFKQAKQIKQPVYYIKTSDLELSTQKCTVEEYQKAFSFVTSLNESMEVKKQNLMTQFGLVEGEYDAMMIRRGEKIFNESYYIFTNDYLEKLIEKGTRTIFVQTDDYNAFLEVSELVKSHPEIKVVTTCPSSQKGIVNFKQAREGLDNLFYNKVNPFVQQEDNKAYCEKSVKEIKKSIEEYTPEEKKQHAEEVILGLEICSRSRFLVMDLQSNVSRYLFLKHNNLENIIIVDSKNPLDIKSVIPTKDTLIQFPIYNFKEYLPAQRTPTHPE